MKRTIQTLLLLGLALVPSLARAEDNPYLGRLSANRYDPRSISNPYGTYGSPYNPNSVNNPYGTYGSPYSPKSATNPYATDTPRIYGSDGKYLGKLSKNPYDPDSISNPYGTYGNQYNPNSVNNRYGTYGNPYSPKSTTNPYATDTPLVLGAPERTYRAPSYSPPSLPDYRVKRYDPFSYRAPDPVAPRRLPGSLPLLGDR